MNHITDKREIKACFSVIQTETPQRIVGNDRKLSVKTQEELQLQKFHLQKLNWSLYHMLFKCAETCMTQL